MTKNNEETGPPIADAAKVIETALTTYVDVRLSTLEADRLGDPQARDYLYSILDVLQRLYPYASEKERRQLDALLIRAGLTMATATRGDRIMWARDLAKHFGGSPELREWLYQDERPDDSQIRRATQDQYRREALAELDRLEAVDREEAARLARVAALREQIAAMP